jgi:alkylhydroperoxidase family enzyme
VARSVGVPHDKVAALSQGPDAPVFDETERLILRFTDAVVRDVKAPDELFNAVLAKLDHRRMTELVITIGFYMMVSRFLENFEVDIEPPGTIK